MALWMMPSDYESLADTRKKKTRAKAKNERDVWAEVDARDGNVCRGCDGYLRPGKRERHHIIPRSALGPTTVQNLVSLCAPCHEDITRHRITVTGNADKQLTFSSEGRGTWISRNPKKTKRD